MSGQDYDRVKSRPISKPNPREATSVSTSGSATSGQLAVRAFDGSPLRIFLGRSQRKATPMDGNWHRQNSLGERQSLNFLLNITRAQSACASPFECFEGVEKVSVGSIAASTFNVGRRLLSFLHERISNQGRRDIYSTHQSINTPSYAPRARCRHSSPKLARTFALHFLRKAFSSSLHILAASTFAGLSSLGLLSMEMTLSKMVSGVCTGDHLSATDS